jgi:hypothetical protein
MGLPFERYQGSRLTSAYHTCSLFISRITGWPLGNGYGRDLLFNGSLRTWLLGFGIWVREMMR